MIGDHSALDLILQASLIVQFVMALLVGASVVSWAIIFRKRQLLKTERVGADQFEDKFWSGGDLSGLYKSLEAGSATGMAGVFVAGFREFSRLRRQAGIGAAELLEGSRRAMRVAQLRETDRLEELPDQPGDEHGPRRSAHEKQAGHFSAHPHRAARRALPVRSGPIAL